MNRSTPLKRTKGLSPSGGPSRTGAKKRRAISPASPAQRERARTEPCAYTGLLAEDDNVIDFAHLCARGRGGCDDPLCGVPLLRSYHRLFDDGKFDLLPCLVGRFPKELAHALEHYDGNLLGLLQRLTGVRWVPEGERR